MTKSIPSIFNKIIPSKFHITANDDEFLIREEERDAKCRWIKIKQKKSIDSFCFSIDSNREKGELDPIFPFFNVDIDGLESPCSKNDAILVCKKNAKSYIFLIELKSTLDKKTRRKALHQIKSSELLMNFIIDRLNLANKNLFNKEQIEFRGLLFHCPRAGSEGTTKKKYKVEFLDNDGLLVAEMLCHNTYHLTQFLHN